ncbi:MAG: 6-bladed beta-propeller [Bacteroidota bacterium]
MKVFATIILLSVCINQLSSQIDTSKLVWPAPPEQARITHLLTISSIQNFKHEGGFFSKIVGFIFGESHSQQWLVQPVGIAISPKHQIYITDPGAKGIHILDQDKEEYEFVNQTKFGSFLSPVGIAFSSDGSTYISDSEHGDITVLNEDRKAQFQIKDHLLRPTGLLILNDTLYVADAARHEIVLFDLKGKFLMNFGQRGESSGNFNFPIALAGENSLFVIDALNYRVQKFTTMGGFISAFGRQGGAPGSFASPKGIALDSEHHIYVTDVLMDNFQIFNEEGQLLLVVGKKGDRDGQFMSPSGIAIDDKDRIYIVDMLNKRIQMFQYLKENK